MSDAERGAAVSVRGVGREFRAGSERLWALKDVSLEIAPGEFVALIGRSGSGKTTLLNVIAGLDRPTEGDILIDGRSVPAMSERELISLRRHSLGFVFQSFGLLPLLSAQENVELPLRIAGTGHAERTRRVRQVLDMVGLGRRARHRPYELSGGEQQRVAIARALAIRPRLILADEPTGELDSTTALTIFTLLRDTARAEGVTIITSTHDRLVIELAGRVEELANGRHVTGDERHLLRAVIARDRGGAVSPSEAQTTGVSARGDSTAIRHPTQPPDRSSPPSPPMDGTEPETEPAAVPVPGSAPVPTAPAALNLADAWGPSDARADHEGGPVVEEHATTDAGAPLARERQSDPAPDAHDTADIQRWAPPAVRSEPPTTKPAAPAAAPSPVPPPPPDDDAGIRRWAKPGPSS